MNKILDLLKNEIQDILNSNYDIYLIVKNTSTVIEILNKNFTNEEIFLEFYRDSILIRYLDSTIHIKEGNHKKKINYIIQDFDLNYKGMNIDKKLNLTLMENGKKKIERDNDSLDLQIKL